MSKVGIGVGEEFPLGDPPPDTSEPERPHRHAGWHLALNIALRLALLALIIAGIVWMFTGFGVHPGYAPYGYHRHFFFPFFPLLLVLLLIFAFRRRHYYGYCHFRRWHDELHRGHGERF